jgi:hypothetical protein
MLDRVEAKPTALLCYQRDPADSHQTLLLAAVAGEADVVDLFA